MGSSLQREDGTKGIRLAHQKYGRQHVLPSQTPSLRRDLNDVTAVVLLVESNGDIKEPGDDLGSGSRMLGRLHR